MNWSRISSLEDWKGFALETVWKLAPSRENTDVKPTWPLDPRDLESVHVLWPSKYEWSPSGKWVEPLRHGLCKYVKTQRTNVPQPFKGIVMVQIVIREIVHSVAIDYSDLPHINENCARSCPLYFKMQFSREGYPFAHIVPGGFVPNSDDIYRYLPSVRAIADKNSRCYDVYGRFGVEFASDIRRKACSFLAQQDYFRWEGSLQIKRYSLALREIARSKICIDLPGNGDFCFRLIDYFAVGSCVIAPRHRTMLHVPLEDRKNIVYANDDLSDLVDLCRSYLADDAARREVARNSRSHFERYLHRDQLAAYYLRCCLDKLS
jgi:hypothetical protein